MACAQHTWIAQTTINVLCFSIASCCRYYLFVYPVFAMDPSDSDSDDFFSDIRALRRKFGLKGALTPVPMESKAQKRKAEPQHTPAKPHKRRSTGATESSASATEASANTPPSSEIAALLSSRRRRRSSGIKIAETPSRIPARTPESRIANPLAPLQVQNLTPETRPPVALPLAGSPNGRVQGKPRMDKGKGTPSPARTLRPAYKDIFAITPDSRMPSVRGLWDKVEDSPRNTPTRRLSAASPASSSKRPFKTPLPAIGFGVHNSFAVAEADSSNGNGLLGSVEEALLTDTDIDLAKRKLGEEQALTQQQILRETRERLLQFSLPTNAGSLTLDAIDAASSVALDSVTLLCQFYTFGYGKLLHADNGVVWRGDLLGPIATVAQSAAGGIPGAARTTEIDTVLVFPWTQVTGLRRKSVDDEEYIMLTVDEDMGVAFRIDGQQSVGEIDVCVDTMAKQLSLALKPQHRRDEGALLELPGQSHQQADDLPLTLAGTTAPEALVHALLLKAKEATQHQDLSISRALAIRSFRDSAALLISDFSMQLAEKARAALEASDDSGDSAAGAASSSTAYHSVAEEDPGTETLPGMCTLCYANNETIALLPCKHRLCSDCFAHLQSMQPSSSQTSEQDADVACICPWDRNHISKWTKL
ncbi:hypothetical protein GQ54DRAFT_12511 [Martensiomyces pterosporus]|nr:hypothetical protein GQ54DRAFT_12511 [Martensiomyces pterosporus]